MYRINNKKRINFDENNSLKTQVTLSRMYGSIVTFLLCIVCIMYMNQNNKFVEQQSSLVQERNFLQLQVSSLETGLREMNNKYESFKESVEVIYKQNESLAKSNDVYYEKLCEYSEREELLNKYEYALFDKSENRTDITYDQLVSVENLVKESDHLYDTDLILSLIMTESEGKEKAQSKTSTAKGYGQLLNGTAKFVYNELLEKDDHWKPSVALDGDTNIEMTIAYMEYLSIKNNKNIYSMIRNYRGKPDISGYVNCMNSYLKSKDKTVQDIYLACR